MRPSAAPSEAPSYTPTAAPVLEGAVRGAELRPDDGRALVEHADEAAEHVRAELRPVAAALVFAAADARAELFAFVCTDRLGGPLDGTVLSTNAAAVDGNTELRADADGHGANVRTLEDAHSAELLPDASALARADQNPDAVTKLELLAELRTHVATDVETVGRALFDPDAAALDADAERRSTPMPSPEPSGLPTPAPTLQQGHRRPSPTSLPTQVPTKWQCHLSEEDFAASMQYKVYASCPWSAATVESTPIKYSADCISPPAGHPTTVRRGRRRSARSAPARRAATTTRATACGSRTLRMPTASRVRRATSWMCCMTTARASAFRVVWP